MDLGHESFCRDGRICVLVSECIIRFVVKPRGFSSVVAHMLKYNVIYVKTMSYRQRSTAEFKGTSLLNGVLQGAKLAS